MYGTEQKIQKNQVKKEKEKKKELVSKGIQRSGFTGCLNRNERTVSQ